MTTLYSNRTITSVSPSVVSTVTYTQSRNGNTQYYNVTVEMNTTSSGGWRNNRWAIKAWGNGNLVANNLTIKPQTSGTIGTKKYYGKFSFSVNTSAATGSIPIVIQYVDTGYSTGWNVYQNWGKQSGTVYFNPLSIVTLSLNSKTNNSITCNYGYSNIAPQYIHVYNGGTYLGQYNSSPFTIVNLSGNTTYGDLKAYGYANGGFGNPGNSISVKTYPNPVSVSNISISNINPFGCSVKTSSSSSSTTNLIEYSVLNSNGQIVQGPTTTGSYSWNISGLNPESQYTIRVRMRTSESNIWSNYKTNTFKTLTDQAKGYIKVNGIWSKGKMYIKNNGVWAVAKYAYIKKNNIWSQSTNN